MTRLAAYVAAAATAAAVLVVVVASVVPHYRFRRRNASVSADGQETLAQDEHQARWTGQL
jgi:hypothetical protein